MMLSMVMGECEVGTAQMFVFQVVGNSGALIYKHRRVIQMFVGERRMENVIVMVI